METFEVFMKEFSEMPTSDQMVIFGKFKEFTKQVMDRKGKEHEENLNAIKEFYKTHWNG